MVMDGPGSRGTGSGSSTPHAHCWMMRKTGREGERGRSNNKSLINLYPKIRRILLLIGLFFGVFLCTSTNHGYKKTRQKNPYIACKKRGGGGGLGVGEAMSILDEEGCIGIHFTSDMIL